ncbi:hypothetical protein COL99_24340 [Bacillus toyonensis]|uniref:hypothetical protein n=1 Tax=Bacillus toyonensis TaxID=155322 RepID=UPI000BF25B0D|nr:hypothetical protein [Bacillus toyonensis]PGC09924.1 hypothetical protein COL99_24340 [Bacillus toyonensis]
MNKMIFSKFVFRNIGQGMFYTGQIADFNFVYDCGSESGKKMMNPAIKEYKSEFLLEPGKKGNLDMLVLSHFDKDHVNGVTELLNNFHVHTVVIPYLYPIERLRLIAKYNNENKGYRNLVTDPIEYFSQFNVEQIILLDRNYLSDQDQISNDNIIEPSDNENLDRDNDDLLSVFDNLPDSDIKEVIEVIENLSQSSKKVQIKIKKRGSVKINGIWEFLFFNYDSTPDVLETLTKCATVNGKRLFVKTELLDLLASNKANKINEQYKKMIKKIKTDTNIKNINNTSIVLNHMPINYEFADTFIELDKKNEILPKRHKKRNPKRIHSINAFKSFKESNSYTYYNDSCYVGTLLFGDINVKQDLNQIINFFDHKLHDLSIISVPHHGSKYNWDLNLFEILDTKRHKCPCPANWVVSCGYGNKYGHPDQIVLKQFMPNSENQLFINNEMYALHIEQVVELKKISLNEKMMSGLKI